MKLEFEHGYRLPVHWILNPSWCLFCKRTFCIFYSAEMSPSTCDLDGHSAGSSPCIVLEIGGPLERPSCLTMCSQRGQLSIIVDRAACGMPLASTYIPCLALQSSHFTLSLAISTLWLIFVQQRYLHLITTAFMLGCTFHSIPLS